VVHQRSSDGILVYLIAGTARGVMLVYLTAGLQLASTTNTSVKSASVVSFSNSQSRLCVFIRCQMNKCQV
jgi:hypothetical protein